MRIMSEEAMRELGARLAGQLKPGDVVLFEGDLGVGKSFLIRAILRSMADDATLEVPSPSFTLVQNYKIGGNTINHIDLYRLGAMDELYELGIPAILNEAISLIEWPERLGAERPQNAITVRISDAGGEVRGLDILGLEL